MGIDMYVYMYTYICMCTRIVVYVLLGGHEGIGMYWAYGHRYLFLCVHGYMYVYTYVSV